jgi:ssDNA-binding Zn-finger/Zn-ribbon topoisomerase 1
VTEHGYGLPLRCPKCPAKNYFGMLKVPGVKAVPCPNCGTGLMALRKKRQRNRSLTPQAGESP